MSQREHESAVGPARRSRDVLVSFLGSIVRIRVRFNDNLLTLDTFNSSTSKPPHMGEEVAVSFGRGDLQPLEEGVLLRDAHQRGSCSCAFACSTACTA